MRTRSLVNLLIFEACSMEVINLVKCPHPCMDNLGGCKSHILLPIKRYCQQAHQLFDSVVIGHAGKRNKTEGHGERRKDWLP